MTKPSAISSRVRAIVPMEHGFHISIPLPAKNAKGKDLVSETSGEIGIRELIVFHFISLKDPAMRYCTSFAQRHTAQHESRDRSMSYNTSAGPG